jgi:hypothetical protein
MSLPTVEELFGKRRRDRQQRANTGSRYTWVNHEGTKLYAVGILADGTLYNPNGYPDDLVRTAVLAADARRHERRSRAAKKAAATKLERRELKVQIIAKRIAAAQATGPRKRCYVCGRGLTDLQSISRGIGSECWQDALTALTRIKRAHQMALSPAADIEA